MDMTLATSTNVSKAAQTASGTSSAGKADGKDGTFNTILMQQGETAASADEKEGTDGLLSMMAALAGGLSPIVMQGLIPELKGTTAGVNGDSLSLDLIVQGQPLTVTLPGMSMTNQELAQVLQAFGAAPALLSVLLDNPTGNPMPTLAAHPEVIRDLGQTLSQAVQAAVSNPQLFAKQPETAAWMQSLVAQVANALESTATLTQQGAQSAIVPKSQQLLGKLQASLTAHSLQVNAAGVESVQAVNAQTSPAGAAAALLQAAQAETAAAIIPATTVDESLTAPSTDSGEGDVLSLVTSASQPAPHSVQAADRPVKAEGTVALKAERFHSEFQQVVIKRAALIEAPGRQEFRIILEPSGLGEIEVRIQANGNQLTLQFNADTALAKGMLDAGLAGLKAQLQASGLQFDRIEVNTNQQSQDQNANSGLPQERGNGQGAEGQGRQGESRSEADAFSIEALIAELEAEAEPEAEGEAGENLDVNA